MYTNLTYLTSLSKGNTEFTKKLINTFITTANGDIEKFNQFLEKKDYEGIGNIAHKMKPSLQLMGIESLQQPVAELETFARENINTEKIPQLVAEVINVLKLSIDELKEKLPQVQP